MIKTYETKDAVLPQLEIPNPCPIRIVIDDESVLLFIGPRDFQWDKETGEWLGQGTTLA